MSTVFSPEVQSWLRQISGSLPNRIGDAREELESGVLIAEILSGSFPKQCVLADFEYRFTSAAKNKNWNLLESLFDQLRIPVPSRLAESVKNGGTGGAELITVLYKFLVPQRASNADQFAMPEIRELHRPSEGGSPAAHSYKPQNDFVYFLGVAADEKSISEFTEFLMSDEWSLEPEITVDCGVVRAPAAQVSTLGEFFKYKGKTIMTSTTPGRDAPASTASKNVDDRARNGRADNGLADNADRRTPDSYHDRLDGVPPPGTPPTPTQQPQANQEVDLAVIAEGVNQAHAASVDITNKDAVLIVGLAGAGKTTTILYLLGHQLRTDDSGPRVVVTTLEPVPGLEIGHEYDGMTRDLGIFEPVDWPGWVLLDSPGFEDPNPSRDITHGILIAEGIRKATSLRILVLVPTSTFRPEGGRGTKIAGLLRILGNFLNPIDKYINNIAFVLSHVRDEHTVRTLLSEVASLSRSLLAETDAELKIAVSAIRAALEKHGERILLRANRNMTDGSGPYELRSVLESTPAIVGGAALGCPMSPGTIYRLEAAFFRAKTAIGVRLRSATATDCGFIVDELNNMQAVKDAVRHANLTAVFDDVVKSVVDKLLSAESRARSLAVAPFDRPAELQQLLQTLKAFFALNAHRDVRPSYTEIVKQINDRIRDLLVQFKVDMSITAEKFAILQTLDKATSAFQTLLHPEVRDPPAVAKEYLMASVTARIASLEQLMTALDQISSGAADYNQPNWAEAAAALSELELLTDTNYQQFVTPSQIAAFPYFLTSIGQSMTAFRANIDELTAAFQLGDISEPQLARLSSLLETFVEALRSDVAPMLPASALGADFRQIDRLVCDRVGAAWNQHFIAATAAVASLNFAEVARPLGLLRTASQRVVHLRLLVDTESNVQQINEAIRTSIRLIEDEAINCVDLLGQTRSALSEKLAQLLRQLGAARALDGVAQVPTGAKTFRARYDELWLASKALFTTVGARLRAALNEGDYQRAGSVVVDLAFLAPLVRLSNGELQASLAELAATVDLHCSRVVGEPLPESGGPDLVRLYIQLELLSKLVTKLGATSLLEGVVSRTTGGLDAGDAVPSDGAGLDWCNDRSQLVQTKAAQAVAVAASRTEQLPVDFQTALANRQCLELKRIFDELKMYTSIDAALNGEAARLFATLQATLRSTAMQLHAQAGLALQGASSQKVAAAQDIRQFFEEANQYQLQHHVPDIDFLKLLETINEKSGAAADQIIEQVERSLKRFNFGRVNALLAALQQVPNSDAYLEQADDLICNLLTQLDDQITLDVQLMGGTASPVVDRLQTLAGNLRHAVHASALAESDKVSFDLHALLRKAIDKVGDDFKRCETDFRTLLRFDWVAANNKLNELRRFGTLDGLLANKPLGFTVEPTFTERVANLLKEIEALPQKLVDEVDQAFQFEENAAATAGEPHNSGQSSGSDNGRSALTSSVNVVPIIDPDTIVVNLAVVLNAEKAFASFDGVITPARCRIRLINKLREKVTRVDQEVQTLLRRGDFGKASELLAAVTQVVDSLPGPAAFKAELGFKIKSWRDQYEIVKGNRTIRLTEANVPQVKSALSNDIKTEFFNSCATVNQAAKKSYNVAINKLANLTMSDHYPLFDALRINAVLGLYASELRHREDRLTELFSSHAELTSKIREELAKFLVKVGKLGDLGESDRILRVLQTGKKDVFPKYKLWLPVEIQLWDLLDIEVNRLIETKQRDSRKVKDYIDALARVDLYSPNAAAVLTTALLEVWPLAEATPDGSGDAWIYVSSVRRLVCSAPTGVAAAWKAAKYESIAAALENLLALCSTGGVKDEAANAAKKVHQEIESNFKVVNSELIKLFVTKEDFVMLNKMMDAVDLLDNWFHKRLPAVFPELLASGVLRTIEAEVEEIVRRGYDGSVQDLFRLQDLLIEMKLLVRKVNSATVQNIVSQRMKRIINSCFQQSKEDTFRLGEALRAHASPIGSEIVDEFPEFKGNRIAAHKKVTTHLMIDDVLKLLLDINTVTLSDGTKQQQVTGETCRTLKVLYDAYSAAYNENMDKYMFGRQQPKQPLDELVKKVKARATEVLRNRKSYGPMKSALAELLAGVFATWSILTSEETYRVHNKTDVILEPHPIQIVAILRLLGADVAESAFTQVPLFGRLFSEATPEGHLVQLGTGEGKSILLGGLATVLSLFGFEVHCVCYSKYLSERDYEAFLPLFEKFGLLNPKKVSYSTIDEAMEAEINSSGNVRDIFKACLSSGRSPGGKLASVCPKILLVDEVDVFFSMDFFGSEYTPAATVLNEHSKALFNHVWSTRSSAGGCTFRQVAALPAYTSLVNGFAPVFRPLVDKEIKRMLAQLAAVSSPGARKYVIQDGLVGYPRGDTISTSTSYGYETAFHYLDAVGKGVKKEVAEQKLCFTFPCGSFSYARLQDKFACILGVSGTISCLTTAERDLIAKHFNLKKFTYMPSIYGSSKKPGIEIKLETSDVYYAQALHNEIMDRRSAGQPVLVFFENNERLEQYANGSYGFSELGDDVQIVTEKTPIGSINQMVKRATEKSAITLLVKQFGRGLDFVCYDQAANKAGGVHVVQAFFSDIPSEELQIIGRTARQSKPGTYNMILLSAHIEDRFKVSAEEIAEAKNASTVNATGDFYSRFLCGIRNKYIEGFTGELMLRAENCKEMHTKSMELLALLLKPTPANVNKTCQLLSDLNNDISPAPAGMGAYHVVFCLDDSGSMSGKPWQELTFAVELFVNRRLKDNSDDVVTIINYNSTATIKAEKVPIRDNPLRFLKFGSGGTVFAAGLQKVIDALGRTDFNTLQPTVLFLSDGGSNTPTDGDAEAAAIKAKFSQHKLEFYALGFGAGADTRRLQKIAELAGGKFLQSSNNIELSNNFGQIATQLGRALQV